MEVYMSNDLQTKFKNISDELDRLNLQKAKAEANLETLEKEKQKVHEEIKELANANSVEEAKEKLTKLKEKLNTLSKEAEAVLNDTL